MCVCGVCLGGMMGAQRLACTGVTATLSTSLASAGPPLAGLWTGGELDASMRRICTETLRSLVEDPRGLRAAAPLLLQSGEVMLVVLGAPTAATMLPPYLAIDASPAHLALALNVVGGLLRAKDGPAAFWGVLNSTRLLADLVATPTVPAALRHQATSLLLTYCKSLPDAQLHALSLFNQQGGFFGALVAPAAATGEDADRVALHKLLTTGPVPLSALEQEYDVYVKNLPMRFGRAATLPGI